MPGPPAAPLPRAAKRGAVVTAARETFARDGFTRASIDAIAVRAGVSTRTIYNHFSGKGDLFAAALLEGAEQVAEAFAAQLPATAHEPADVRAELIAIGRAFIAQGITSPEHFALVAQMRADVAHVPRELVDAWHRAGPLRVQQTIAARLEALRDQRLLRVPDPERATLHLVALVTAGATVRPPGAPAPAGEAADELVVAGVDVFLHGYAAR